jgi:lipid-binding SYLF domain-containing protein
MIPCSSNLKIMYMEKRIILPAIKFVLVIAALAIGSGAIAQSTSKERKLVRDSKVAKEEFIATDGLMKSLFDNSYGWVTFANVGKGGIGIGGAAGNGIVYERGTIIGKAKLTQVSIGFQFGGQAYREVIFFETKADLDRFKENKIEFSAQASAVAVTVGASGNVKYKDGVMIFTQQKGGLMYEASVGGQKFNYSTF